VKQPVRQIFVPAAPPGAGAVDLVFAPSRGSLRLLKHDDSPYAAVDDAPASKHHDGVLNATIRADKQGPVLISWEGEPPELVKLVFRRDTGEAFAVYVPPPGTCLDEPTAFLRVLASGSEDPAARAWFRIRGPTELLDALDDLLASAPDTPVTRYRKYFADLNRNTHSAYIPTLVDAGVLTPCESEERRAAIHRVRNRCQDRIFERMSSVHLSGACTHFEPSGIKQAVELLSTLQLGLLDKHMHGRLAEIEEAYEMFANGALRLQLDDLRWSTQPSSAFYFAFGEFALFAMDDGVDVERWRQLAPVLIRTQSVYRRVYAPTVDSPTFDSYSPCAYDPRRTFGCRELRALAESYAGASDYGLHWLAAENAIDAFPGHLSSP